MKTFYDLSLSVRLNLLVGIIVTLAVVVMTILNYQTSRQHRLRELDLQSRHLTALMLNRVSSDMQSIERSTNLLSGIVQRFTGSDNELRKLLKNMVSTNANLYGGSILVTDEWRDLYHLKKCDKESRQQHLELSPFNCFFGDYFYEAENGLDYYDLSKLAPDFSHFNWYTESTSATHPAWIGPYRSSIEKKYILSYAIPIYRSISNNITRMAIVISDLSLSRLQDLINSIAIDTNSTTFLLDNKGNTFKKNGDVFTTTSFKYFFSDQTIPTEWKKMLNTIAYKDSGTRILPCISNANEECMFSYYAIPNTDLSIGLSYSISGALKELRQYTLRLALFSLAMLIALLVIIRWICLTVTRPLGLLSLAAQRIGQGHFDQKLPKARHKDEVGTLVQAFTTMQSQLVSYTTQLKSETAQRNRWEGEMDAASIIQLAMLPENGLAYFKHKPIELWAHLVPAKSVGGDFYHFGVRNDKNLIFVVGDVSDKGVSAALFMAKALSLFKHEMSQGKSLPAILTSMNNELMEQNDACMFVTLFCGDITLDTGNMQFICAGHQPPYLIRHNQVSTLETKIAPAIGLNANIAFPVNSIAFEPRDKLFIFTDGIDEAFNRKGDMFGISHIKQLLQKKSDCSIQEIGLACFDEVNKFSQGTPKSDDITIMTLTFEPDFRFLIPGIVNGEIAYFHYDNDMSSIKQSLMDIDHLVETWSLGHQANDIKLVVEELINNCISYGQIPENEKIELYLGRNDQFILIEVIDKGVAFNPLSEAPAPPTEKNPLIGGLGIHFVKSLTQKQAYIRKNNKNYLCVSLSYR